MARIVLRPSTDCRTYGTVVRLPWRVMSTRDLRHLFITLLAVGGLCVLPIALGAPLDLLLVAPLVLVALPLVLGRYVGEGAIERLARRVARRRTARRSVVVLSPRREWHLPQRTGALLAHAVGVRPPPAARSAR